MTTFSIEDFAAECKQTMARAENLKQALADLLAETIARCGSGDVMGALQAAIPPGASIGELIVHASPELTMLYAQIPARFQSGIHNHTVCAVIAQLAGDEVNHIYERGDDGAVREVQQLTVRAGDVITLDRDVVHSIENPGQEPAHALHLYKGDFRSLSDRRSLWSWGDREEKPFSFPELLKESATAMHHSGNSTGLDALVEAMPVSKDFVETLRS